MFFPRLLRLLFESPAGGSETLGVAGGLTRYWKSVRLDRVDSVSGLELLETHWDDALINEQYQRFLNGF